MWIITTKSIDTSEYLEDDTVGLNDRSALGILDFDFMPYWNEEQSKKKL